MTKTGFITGASTGIGAVFARRLAKEGYALVLVARREQMLEQLAAELSGTDSANVTVLRADLSQPEGLARTVEAVDSMPALDLLINNAGFGTQGKFPEKDVESQLGMVTVHIEATMRLCRAALPKMLAKRQGAIINVSSIAGFIPVAGNVTYIGTKAFLNAFSQALQWEVADSGVRIQALCPGFTHTGFHSSKEYGEFDRSRIPRWLWMDAESVVDTSLGALGKDKVIVIPGFKNRMLVRLARSRILAKMLRGVRRRLLK